MQELIETTFGTGVTTVMILVWLIMGLFGLITSLVFDVYSSGASASELSFKIWWKDNKWRLALSVIVIILAMVFGEELIGMITSNWSMFLAGFTSDKLIENLLQRRRRKTQIK